MPKTADLTSFCQVIQHASCKEKKVESADCKAILFDENDNGFVSSLDKKNYNSNVDYIEIIENGIILIELRDLSEHEPLNPKISKDTLDNLTKKYFKSIEKHIAQKLIPTLYYVVVKNNTEIVIKDNFFTVKEIKKEFKRTEYFTICTTNEICEKLSTLDTRLCQE